MSSGSRDITVWLILAYFGKFSHMHSFFGHMLYETPRGKNVFRFD